MDYRQIFKKELASVYSERELDILFKMLIADIKDAEFTHILLADFSLNDTEESVFYEAIHQLKALKPIQHILRKADFYGLQFAVTAEVLIPRPETEELVHLIFAEHKNKTVHMLDIGTGSGCIAITLKRKLPLANVSALDVSVNALAIAKQNAEQNRTEITFFLDDALNLVATNYPKYDVIVSNPPYIAQKEKENIEKIVLDNDPHLALFVEDDEPLIFYDKIADFALTNLKPSGVLYFEINQNFAKETKLLIEDKGFKVTLIKDLNDNFRIVKAQLLG